MNSPKDFEKYLQGLVDRHYSDLQLILQRLGVDEDPTPQVLLSTFITYGPKFSKLVALLPEDNANGSGWEKIQNIFTKGAELITLGAGAYATAKTAGQFANQQAQPVETQVIDEPVQKNGTTKILLIGGVVVVVLIIVFVVIKKIKK